MKYFFIRSFLYLAMASTVAHGALLSIDVNGGSSPTESGFIGQNSSGVTHSTIVGDIAVSYAGQQGAFDRGDQGQPNPDLYRARAIYTDPVGSRRSWPVAATPVIVGLHVSLWTSTRLARP